MFSLRFAPALILAALAAGPADFSSYRTPAEWAKSRPLGKGVPAGFGDKPDRHYAVHLAERGYVTLAPDYVNMGESKFDVYGRGYVSATMKGIWNHLRCDDYLRSLSEVDGERIAA